MLEKPQDADSLKFLLLQYPHAAGHKGQFIQWWTAANEGSHHKNGKNAGGHRHPGEPTPALLSDSFSATQNTLRFRSAKNLPKFQETEHPETEKGSKKEKKHKDKQQRSEWQTATG